MIGHRELTAQDYWEIFRRRRWVILTPVIICPIIALALTWVLPSRWTSKSVILIEGQKVPSNFVQPVITEGLNARLATMQERILSRAQLERLIQKYDLFKSDSAGQPMGRLERLTQKYGLFKSDSAGQPTGRLERLIRKYNFFKSDSAGQPIGQLVARLRKAIELAAVSPEVTSQGSNEALPGFSVSVTLDDPHTAQKACTEVTSMFINENLRQREQTAQETTNFMQGQLDDAKQSLNEQDAKLAAFQEKYFGMLPDETQTSLNILETLNTQLQAVTNQLSRVGVDKAYHDSLLNQALERLQAGKDTPSDPQVELKTLQDKLAALELHYTSDYPDVVRLKLEIKDLKERIQKAKTERVAESPGKASSPASDEPPDVLRLRYQIRIEKQTIDQLSSEQTRLQHAIKQYESRLQLSPQVERKYKELTRDHATALSVYNGLLRKRDESRMATDLERSQHGEQFVLLDPANLPQDPSFPKRSKFGGAGLVAGIALGVALAFLLELRDKTLRNELDVQAVLGAYPLARIPLFEKGKGGGNGVALVVPDVSVQQQTVTQK